MGILVMFISLFGFFGALKRVKFLLWVVRGLQRPVKHTMPGPGLTPSRFPALSRFHCVFPCSTSFCFC